jgi:choline kinase/phosphatidylglycerophosphate synthase
MEIAPGVTIIDFILKQLHEIGVREVIVATRGEYVSAFKEELGKRARIVVVDGNGEGNLHSLALACEAVGPRRVLVIMGDHVFEPEILRRLLEEDDASRRMLLCLDTRPKGRDLLEGLRVHVSVDSVHRVGKSIPPQGGVDTGLFVLSADAHDLIRRVENEEGHEELSSLVNHLAAKGDVGYVDVTKKLWLDIDTAEDLAEARRLYWEILRRSLYKPGDGPVSHWLNRPLSTRLSIFLFKHAQWVTPNSITVISFVLALVSAFLFTQWQFGLGAVLVYVSSLLDGVDGEIARLGGKLTGFGSLLDSLLDRIADIALMIGLGLVLSPGPLRVGLTGLAVSGVVLVSYISHLSLQHTDVKRLRGGFPWATRDVRLLLISLGGLAFQPLIPVVFCATAPFVFAARSILHARTDTKLRAGPTLVQTTGTKIPEPEIPVARTDKIRRHLESLLLNFLELVLALVLLQLARMALGYDLGLNALIAPLNAGLLLDLAWTLALVYFGYRILISVKFFADKFTDLVVTRVQITQDMYARVITDLFYLIVLGLAWSVASSILPWLPPVISFLSLAVNLVFLSLALLLAYDSFRTLRRGLGVRWESMIERVADWVTMRLQSSEDETAEYADRKEHWALEEDTPPKSQ